MSFGDAVRTCYGKYATFAGRARRSEFWWFYLFTLLPSALIWAVAFLAGSKSGGGFSGLGYLLLVIATVWALANIIPTIAVSVRRLHDSDRSGWWFWIQLIPCGIGYVWFLVLLIIEGTRGPNTFGPEPS